MSCNTLARVGGRLWLGTRAGVGIAARQQTRGLRAYRERTVRAMYWRGRSFDVVKFPERRPDENSTWNYRSEIYAFSRRLDENLSEDTLRQIFTQPSYLNLMSLKQSQLGLPGINISSNAELVQRGDTILDECIKPYLRHSFDRLPEDGIEAITSYLKSDNVMEDIAKWIGCRDIILAAEWPPHSTTMAATVRALVAGIEKESNLSRARRFIVDIIISYLNDKDILEDVWLIPHPADTLKRILSNSQLPAYEPRIIFQTGVKTIESCHLVGLYVNQKLLGYSPGETLAIAEECAALDSLQRLFDLRDSRAPLIYGDAADTIDYAAHMKSHQNLTTWRFELT